MRGNIIIQMPWPNMLLPTTALTLTCLNTWMMSGSTVIQILGYRTPEYKRSNQSCPTILENILFLIICSLRQIKNSVFIIRRFIMSKRISILHFLSNYIIVLLPIFTLCVTGPTEIYFGNYKEVRLYLSRIRVEIFIFFIFNHHLINPNSFLFT